MVVRLRDKIFSEEIINRGRQNELDLAKAVLIFCLALVHCTIECTPEEELVKGVPFLFDSVIGGPFSAPMFMFAMGVGMVYTRRSAPGDYARRGVQLGMVGYGLNICRFGLPYLVGYGMTGDYNKYIDPLPYRILGNDILQFASLAMLLIALLVRLHISCKVMFLLCLGLSLLGTYFNGTDMGTPLGNIFWGYLIGTEDAAGKVFSDFPLLNWLLMPVSGFIFGKCLLYVKDKGLFYGIVSTAGILVTAIYFPIGIRYGWGMFGEGQNCYYHMNTADAIASLAATVGILGIYYATVPYLPKKILALAGEISRHINRIYCIHWVLVVFSTNVILYIWRGTQELSVSLTILLGVCISIVSILAARFWTDHKRKIGGREK